MQRELADEKGKERKEERANVFTWIRTRTRLALGSRPDSSAARAARPGGGAARRRPDRHTIGIRFPIIVFNIRLDYAVGWKGGPDWNEWRIQFDLAQAF